MRPGTDPVGFILWLYSVLSYSLKTHTKPPSAKHSILDICSKSIESPLSSVGYWSALTPAQGEAHGEFRPNMRSGDPTLLNIYKHIIDACHIILNIFFLGCLASMCESHALPCLFMGPIYGVRMEFVNNLHAVLTIWESWMFKRSRYELQTFLID